MKIILHLKELKQTVIWLQINAIYYKEEKRGFMKCLIHSGF